MGSLRRRTITLRGRGRAVAAVCLGRGSIHGLLGWRAVHQDGHRGGFASTFALAAEAEHIREAFEEVEHALSSASLAAAASLASATAAFAFAAGSWMWLWLWSVHSRGVSSLLDVVPLLLALRQPRDGHSHRSEEHHLQEENSHLGRTTKGRLHSSSLGHLGRSIDLGRRAKGRIHSSRLEHLLGEKH